MKIGDVEAGKVVLGPMAGYTDMPFRVLCIEQGASLTYTEMISAKALYYKNKNTAQLLKTDSSERPVAVQLFGSDPELLASEAARLEEGPYDIFDVNMGCPMPKIVNNGEGSALMREPEKIGRIISAMTGTLKKPVTVKIRKGFSAGEVNAVEVAKIAEDSGAAAVAVHGRCREEYYRGRADLEIIKKVKEAVKIPVIGSGDVFSAKDAKRMIDETGVDAVMVARGARGNPWLFREIRSYLETGSIPDAPEAEEIKSMMIRHAEMMVENTGEEMAIKQMRKHAGFYVTGLYDAARIRREINACRTLAEFVAICGSIA